MSFEARQKLNRLLGRRSFFLFSLPLALRLITGLVILVLLGSLLFMLPGVGTRPLSYNEALFTSASALTVTGLTVITPAEDLTFFGQLLLLVLIQIGGIGLMVFTVVIFRLLGRRISLVERVALRNMYGTIIPGAILKLTLHMLVGVAVLEAVGAVILYLLWQDDLGPATAAWYAIFHAVSALCNAGFDLFAGLPGYATVPNDGGTLAIFGILIFMGSLGVPVMADLLAVRSQERITLHTRLTLGIILFLMILSTTVIFITEGMHPGGVLAGEPFLRKVGLALFQSVSARTAGFVGLPSFEQIAPSSQLVLMIVMFIGAAPASMGGGITTGTAVALSLALWSYTHRRPYPEVSGRMISTETVRRATAVLVVSLAVVIGITLMLLTSNPGLSFNGALFEVVSAFATCGLSLAFTSNLGIFGQVLIILVMIWGRLGALTVMVALTRPAKQALYYFPEEHIMIG
jgi:trk system potassium uptake protein